MSFLVKLIFKLKLTEIGYVFISEMLIANFAFVENLSWELQIGKLILIRVHSICLDYIP